MSGWSAPPPAEAPTMIRSETELEFERFFESVSPPPPSSAPSQPSIEKAHPPPSDLSSKAQNDSDKYRLFLKNKLALECAAYMASNQIPRGTQLGVLVEAKGTGPASSMAQNKVPREPVGTSTLPDMQNKQARQTTSESSREDSDDEPERDTETTDNMGPQDARRARRMRSNRESARRSRRRKQALLCELEEQVEELRKDKNALLQRQESWNRKYGDATVEHRILNAEIEALRAKVRMSEERVKQMSGGYNPFLAMPLVTGSMDASTGPPMAMQTNPDRVFHQGFDGGFTSNSPVSFAAANQQIDPVGNIMAETRRLQEQIGSDASPNRAMPGWNLPQAPINNTRHN